MDRNLRLLYAMAKQEPVSSFYGNISVSDNPPTVTISNTGTVDGSYLLETDTYSDALNTFTMNMLYWKNDVSMPVRTWADLSRIVFSSMFTGYTNEAVNIRHLDLDIYVYEKILRFDTDKIYFAAKDKIVYIGSKEELENLADTFSNLVKYGVSDSELLTIPLMCYACGYKDVWSDFKEHYKNMSTDNILYTMLLHYNVCSESVCKFNKLELGSRALDVISSLNALCKSGKHVSAVSIADYALYKINGNFVIIVNGDICFSTYKSVADLIEDIDGIKTGDTDQNRVDDSVVVIDSLAKMLNKNKVRSTVGILNEVDRLLKLSGESAGLGSLMSIADDIGLVREENDRV